MHYPFKIDKFGFVRYDSYRTKNLLMFLEALCPFEGVFNLIIRICCEIFSPAISHFDPLNSFDDGLCNLNYLLRTNALHASTSLYDYYNNFKSISMLSPYYVGPGVVDQLST